MNFLDYLIIALYVGALVISGFFFKKEETQKGYFLAGNRFGWITLLLSVMATQISIISLFSAPAFVGYKQGGGLQWLTYELGVPLAMLFIIAVILPPLYKSGVTSAYDFLEQRFGVSTRRSVGTAFLLSRSLGTSVQVYAIALISKSLIGLDYWQSILLIFVITMIYTYNGGLKAVIFNDVFQMGLLFFTIVICLGLGLYHLGGWEVLVQKVDSSRLNAVRFDSFGFNGDEFGFLPMLFGGFVLYASYYGCDQTQVQRALSADSLETVRKTYFLNGVARFFVTLLYCIMGLVIGTLVMQQPALLSQIEKPDQMIPVFIMHYVPHGLIGLIMVGLVSDAISSLSSTINSLSAVTVKDFFVRGREVSSDREMRYARYTTLLWAVIISIFASFTGNMATTVIEAINKIGSLFYGPIFAVFILAMLFKRLSAKSVNFGLLIGFLFNVYLWKFQPQIFWFWWNVIGMCVTLGSTLLLSRVFPRKNEAASEISDNATVVSWSLAPFRSKETAWLIAFFCFILIIALLLPMTLR